MTGYHVSMTGLSGYHDNVLMLSWITLSCYHDNVIFLY
jgi:hypothetical protein